MHIYFSNGIAGLELHNFLQSTGLRYEAIQQYFAADWHMPGNLNSRTLGATVFSQNREKSSKEAFKGMASEVLSVFPFLEQLAATVIEPTGNFRNELASFYGMCDIIRLLQKLKRQMPPAVADISMLKQLQRTQLMNCIQAYGEDTIKPKHHYSLHVGDQLLKHGLLVDCFVLERKHRATKRAANLIENSATYESSVMARVFNESVRMNDNVDVFISKLVGSIACSTDFARELGVRNVFVAEKMHARGMTIACNDVLITTDLALEVAACMRVNDKLQLLVKRFVAAPNWKHGRGRRWHQAGDICVWDLEDSMIAWPAECWFFEVDGSMITMG